MSPSASTGAQPHVPLPVSDRGHPRVPRRQPRGAACGGRARQVRRHRRGRVPSRAVNAPGSQDQLASVGPPSVRRGGVSGAGRRPDVIRGSRIAHLELRADGPNRSRNNRRWPGSARGRGRTRGGRCASDALEVALSLPVRHRRVEGGLLGAEGVDVVLDHRRRPAPRGPSRSPRSASVASRSERGSAGSDSARVDVADERRRRLDLLLDPARPHAASAASAR